MSNTLVMGVGNILWADEGFGVRAVEAFHQTFDDDLRVAVKDGGTLGMYLMNDILDADNILFFDCCDLKAPPGTLRVLRDEELALWRTTQISAHQTGINDLLALSALHGHDIERLTVIGVQPQELDDYGGSLTSKVQAMIAPAVQLGFEELGRWGIDLKKRAQGAKVESLSAKVLAKDDYEKTRPSADEACRIGDERFMIRKRGQVFKED